MNDIHVLPYLMTEPHHAQPIVQVLVTQGLDINACAVLVTLHGNNELRLRQRRFGHVFRSRVAVREILRLAVPDEHSHRPALVQFNGHTYLPGEHVLLQPGSHIGVMISEQNVDLFTDQIADGFSLHQTNAVVCRAVVSCKPAPFNEPDDLAMSLPASNLPPHPRPYHDGAEEWSFQLGEILHTHGELDPWDDSRSMTVTTWFIHHQQRPACRQPRTVRLFGHAATWIGDLRNAWADHMDRSIPFSIHIVQPRPPQFRVQRAMCHVLLEQAQGQRFAGVILTALLAGRANDGIIQGAFSVERRLNLPALIRTMDIAHICAGRRCSGIVGRTILPHHDWFDVWSGLSLRVRIEPPEEEQIEQSIEQLHFEDLSLMQTSGNCFQFNVHAPTFDPAMPLISLQPEWVQDLKAIWDQAALPWEGSTRTVVFLTWFVSPGTGLGRCLHSRRASLSDDFTQWQRSLQQIWNDVFDSTHSVDIIVITPSPDWLEPGVAGHILLVQHALEVMSSPLVTIRDAALHQGSPFRLVVTVGERAKPRDILQGTGYDRDCYLQGAQCQLRTGQLAVTEGSFLPVRDGDNVYVAITRPYLPHDWTPPPLPPWPGADEHSLLQTRPRIVPQPGSQTSRRFDKSAQLRLISWFLNDDRKRCRQHRHIVVPSNSCLAKAAEGLWSDLTSEMTCFVYAVETMGPCCKADDGLDEACFLVVQTSSPTDVAVVLEGVLDTGEERSFQHVAILAKPETAVSLLWSELQGRPGPMIAAAVDVFIQGRVRQSDEWPDLQVGSCISFWMDQRKLAAQCTKIDFAEVFRVFDWLDAHFFLPQFDLPEHFPFLPCSLDWTKHWWDPAMGGQRLRLYLDGSHVSSEHGASAGAAVAAFVESEGIWYFAGALSTRLPGNSTSYSAELAASIIASKFAFDILKLLHVVNGTHEVDLTFCYDSVTAGNQTSGKWNAFSEPKFGRLLRSIHKAIEFRYQIAIRYQHVKAHCGEPGHELVDTLAHQAALNAPLHDLRDWLTHVTHSKFVHLAEWIWFLFRQDIRWNGTHLSLPAAPTAVPLQNSQDLPIQQNAPLQEDPAMIGELTLYVATCNVLSLMPQQDKWQAANGPARQDCILRQFDEANIHLFAFQETRLKRLTSTHDPRFWLYRSAATTAGHFGIMIGLARNRPIGTVRKQHEVQKVFFGQEDAVVVASAPRYLILRLKTSLFKAIVIAGHAPHSGATDAEIVIWWETLASTIPDRYAMWPRILLVDANARIGGEPCQHIGPHQAEKHTGKEDGFVQFVRSQGLFLPATFQCCHTGDGGTWLHPTGTWCRNDFVGLPVDWHYEFCHSWISTDIDVGLAKEDHRAAVVHFTRQALILPAERFVKPSKLHLADIEQLAMPPLQPYDWTIDVHTHARMIQEDLVDWFWGAQTKKAARPLKVTMTAETWELVRQKRDARNVLAQHGKLQRQTLLGMWFACWRHAVVEVDLGDLSSGYDSLLRQHDQLIAIAYHCFRTLGRQVVKALRRDDTLFYDHLLHEGSDYLGPKEVKKLWSVVRRSLPKFRQRKMTTPPFQLEGLEDQWLPHFGQLEVGTSTTLPELLEVCVARQTRNLFDAPRALTLSELPSLFALEDAFRRTPAGKATGDDPLPSELFHHGASSLAGTYHDLLIKEFVWQTEPLQYKGGPVAIIPKCLAPTTAKQFRGILLLGNMAKRTHSVLRQQVMAYLEPARSPGQLGGFRGQQVMFGSQALRLFGRMADSRGVSSAVLFLDLSNAFHHLVRELVTGISASAHLDAVLQTLLQTGHPVQQIEAACQLPGLLAELGAPDSLVRLVCDIHAETWCSLPNHQYLHTHRGTRPGSPLADIIFHILMADVAKGIDLWIIDHRVHLPVLPTLDDAFPSVLWADDVAIPLATDQPQDLVPLLLDLLCTVRELLHTKGFLLNFALGKTNAIVSFRGPGASSLRTQYQLIPTPGVECEFADGAKAWLHFVPRYKHLGTVMTSDHGLEAELSARIGLAASAFSHLGRPLLTNRHLPTNVRLRLFQALISSKLFFGLGAWPTLTPKLLQRLTSFYAKLLKRVLHWPIDQWMQPHAQVLAAGQVLDPRARLAVDRLLYAQRVFAVGPFFLQNAIHLEDTMVENSWLAGLKADLHWMSAVTPTGLPDGWQNDLTVLIDSWQTPGVRWKSQVKAVARKHQFQEKMMTDVVAWHKKCFAVLRQAGASFSLDPFETQWEAGDHKCFCGAAFATRRGLLAHQRRKHHLFSIEHQYLQGATCQHCGRYCWTTQRLQQHLAYISKKLGYNPCFQALASQGRVVEYEAVRVPKEVLGLARREFLQTHGPQNDPTTQLSKQRQQWQIELDSCKDQLRIVANHLMHRKEEPELGMLLQKLPKIGSSNIIRWEPLQKISSS